MSGTADDVLVPQESMGSIYDRTRERLGTSDIAVIRMRRIMLAAARSLRDGAGDPPGTVFDGTLKSARSLDILAPADASWQAYAAATVEATGA